MLMICFMKKGDQFFSPSHVQWCYQAFSLLGEKCANVLVWIPQKAPSRTCKRGEVLQLQYLRLPVHNAIDHKSAKL